MRGLLCVGVLLGAALISAQAPDPRSAGATIQGQVRPVAQEQLLLSPAHDARRAAVTKNMHTLLDIVTRNPAFAPPVGLDIVPGMLARTPLIGVNRDVVQYEVAAGFRWYTILSRGTIIPEYVSSVGFYLHANHISYVFEQLETWVEDPTKQTFWEPRQLREESGYPYFHTHTLVMKKSGRPLWIPLTKEQVLAQTLAQMKKAQAELPPEAETRVREMVKRDVACLGAALASLPPAQRSEPAYLSIQPPRPPACSPLTEPTTPQARRVVRENPAFYNKTLPPSDIQLIVLSFQAIQYPPRMWQHAVVEKLRTGLDYGALAALISR
jgi:hypothetical protein